MNSFKTGFLFVITKKALRGACLVMIATFFLSEVVDARGQKRRCYASMPQNRSVVGTPVEFSSSEAKFFDDGDFADDLPELVWEKNDVLPFSELILSWNAHRPTSGSMTFLINVRHNNTWSGWQRLAEWGAHNQRSFVNKNNPYVHTKHVRVEMQHGVLGNAFKVKIVCKGGAASKNLKALFACMFDRKKFKIVRPNINLPSTLIRGVPKQSQMVLNHPRYKDLCSPTSTSIIVNYFLSKMYGCSPSPDLNKFVERFAEQVHDKGELNIYGNWQLNVAQAYEAAHGDVFFKVERLGGFDELYSYIKRKIPVAVSVRHLRGGATPYKNGHFMVVVGWSRLRHAILCIDPAFTGSSRTLRAYKLSNFLKAWAGSDNLSFIPIPQKIG